MQSKNITFCLLLAIAALFVMLGCDSEEGYQTFDANQPDTGESDHGHEHEHPEAPHGGDVIELGDGFHAEVIFEEESGTITIYILDEHAEEAHPIDQKELTLNLTVDKKPLQYKLTSVPQKGEPEGKSSRFDITSEELIDHFHEHEGLKAKLNVMIDGKQHIGNVEHEHEHDDDDKDDDHDKGKP